MKSIKIVSLAVLTLFSVQAFGQKTVPLEKRTIVEKEEISPEQRAKVQTDKLATALDLTQEQKDRIYEINLNVNNKNVAVRKNDAWNNETKAIALKGNNESRDYLIREALTDAQKVKYDEMNAKNESHEGHKH